MIYLDNAATSWPKPNAVIERISNSLKICANPGRSAHSMAVDMGESVMCARENVADFFNATNPFNVIFMKNITEAINTVVMGLLSEGDHVIVSSLEHNSMMRPLRYLERCKKIRLTVIQGNEVGLIDPEEIKKKIRKKTKLIAINHASNVSGIIQPYKEIGFLCRKKNVYYLLDTAQSAGIIPVDVQNGSIDFLAFTGHKSLLGPMGIGGLVLGDRVSPKIIKPLMLGGTGSNSEYETQPVFFPDSLESGTLNVPGILGLDAGINWIRQRGMNSIYENELIFTKWMLEKLSGIPEINILNPDLNSDRVPVISFTSNTYSCSEIGALLNNEYKIMVRIGLHCSPLAHKKMGTFPQGTVRLSLGYSTVLKELEYVVSAIEEIHKRRK